MTVFHSFAQNAIKKQILFIAGIFMFFFYCFFFGWSRSTISSDDFLRKKLNQLFFGRRLVLPIASLHELRFHFGLYLVLFRYCSFFVFVDSCVAHNRAVSCKFNDRSLPSIRAYSNSLSHSNLALEQFWSSSQRFAKRRN